MKRPKIFASLAFLGLLVIGAAGYAAYKLNSTASKVANGNALGLLASTKLDGESAGRVNILLAGNSADDPGHGGAELTDSIMVLSVDTTQNTAFVVSVPRDLWVNVPGYGYEKINAAYTQGGMDQLQAVVENSLGLQINYSTLVNYTAFKQAVDAVGGIDVTIASSDPRGIYDPNIAATDDGPLILANGLQHLDGQTALNLARARNDPTPAGVRGYGLPNGDFDRSANQRLMLVALAKKIQTSGVLANPVKISQLMDAFGNNVTTTFTTSELRRAVEILAKIDPATITSVSLTDEKLLTSYTSPAGASALRPAAGLTDFSQIQEYIQLFLTTAKAASQSPVSD